MKDSHCSGAVLWLHICAENTNKTVQCLEQFKYSNGNGLAADAQSCLLSSGIWTPTKHLGSQPQTLN